MQPIAIVFFGSGFGGIVRYLVNVSAGRAFGLDFPWGIAIINVTGSFLMGVLTGWLAFRGTEGWTPTARLFLGTGILGGYTTFSAFSLDFAVLWERGQQMQAMLYVLGSVGLSLIGIFAGLALVRSLA